MLSDMLTQSMDKKINSDGVPSVYKLKPEILHSLGDSVAVTPFALKKIGHGFNIAKAVEASRAFLKNVPELYKNISSPAGLIALSGQHRQQIRALENLKSAQEVRADLNNTIDKAIAALSASKERMQNCCKRDSHALTDTFVAAYRK